MKFFLVSGLAFNLRINAIRLPTELIYHCERDNLNICIVSRNNETEHFIPEYKLHFKHPSMAERTRSREVSGSEV